MRRDYSFGKTLAKGVASAIGGLIMFVTFAGFADVTIWELIETHVKPIVGALTVGGALTMAKNFIKFNYLD